MNKRKLPRNEVQSAIVKAILDREILEIEYEHTVDQEVVKHRIAPFDIGSTNPDTAERFQNNVYAYSFTHVNSKTMLSDPKVCAFHIEHFIAVRPTGAFFDESELARLNLAATRYDYRVCKFNVARERRWFNR